MNEPTLLLLRILFLLSWLFVQMGYGQSWEQIIDFPATERDDGIVFVIDTKAYCGTGQTPWWTPLGDFYAFDFTNGSWSSVANLPEGEERQYATGFTDGDFGYLFGGLTGNDFLNDLWKYDPASNLWVELPPPPLSPRGGSAALVIGDTAYIIGGRDNDNNALAEVWAFDMGTETWSPKSNFPEGGRWRASTTSHDEKGYLIFGWDETAEYQSGLYEYDPLLDQWTLISSFPGPGRTHATLESFDGKLLVFGGKDSSNTAQGDLWQFGSQTNAWSQLESIPAAGRRGGLAFVHNNQFYYTTGIDSGNNRLKETWKFEVLTGASEMAVREPVVLFPNPARQWLTIDTGLSGHLPPLRMTILDIDGRTVKSGLMTSSNEILDVSKWPKGIYVIQLSNEQWWSSGKFMVE